MTQTINFKSAKKVSEVLTPTDEIIDLASFVNLLEHKGCQLIDLETLADVPVWRLKRMFSSYQAPLRVIVDTLDQLYPRLVVVETETAGN